MLNIANQYKVVPGRTIMYVEEAAKFLYTQDPTQSQTKEDRLY
jgi:hypothetical protein